MLLIGGAGYVGSVLYRELSKTRTVRCVDIGRRGNPGNVPYQNSDYANLSHDALACHDDVILLAGHSSVAECANDPRGAFRNNVVAFQQLLERLNAHQRLIYASSSSVYSGFGATAASEDMNAGNAYDASKYMIDMLASISGKRTYGLRFGTVNGPSPNIRKELMLNSMVGSAINDGFVRIANPKVHRPILGINDLALAVIATLNGDGTPGIYNLASANSTVANYGAIVAAELDVPLVLGESTPTYDFSISSDKFCNEYSFTFSETALSITRDLVQAHGGNGRSDDAVHTAEALSGV